MSHSNVRGVQHSKVCPGDGSLDELPDVDVLGIAQQRELNGQVRCAHAANLVQERLEVLGDGIIDIEGLNGEIVGPQVGVHAHDSKNGIDPKEPDAVDGVEIVRSLKVRHDECGRCLEQMR